MLVLVTQLPAPVWMPEHGTGFEDLPMHPRMRLVHRCVSQVAQLQIRVLIGQRFHDTSIKATQQGAMLRRRVSNGMSHSRGQAGVVLRRFDFEIQTEPLVPGEKRVGGLSRPASRSRTAG